METEVPVPKGLCTNVSHCSLKQIKPTETQSWVTVRDGFNKPWYNNAREYYAGTEKQELDLHVLTRSDIPIINVR